MGDYGNLIGVTLGLLLMLIILRAFGAWALRINEVLYELRVIKDIKKLNLSEGQKRDLATKYPLEFEESADTGDSLWRKS
jgi:predicted DNA-binding antitoxin AbrB/MazE fold protein|tara:strand:+ start:489 stop:728 length:240 start_codon:yes stop_codon:yes gene_type:complete